MIPLSRIVELVAELHQPAYRAQQIYCAITRDLVSEFSEITTLPVSLRRALEERAAVQSLRVCETQEAPREAVAKTLFTAADGSSVESVLMLYPSRATVCLSSQVGCAVGCAFCASGQLGLRRDLTAEEMMDQVLHFARRLKPAGRRVTNVVVMGMGEPFHAYDETLRACRLLNDPAGFGLAARGISISTAGVVAGVERFATEPEQFNLAVSLHAATDELRSELVPLNRTAPLGALLSACRKYVQHTRRQLMFEYVLLPGVNDTGEQVRALARALASPLYHLNVIPYNETVAGFRRPTPAEVASFSERLTAAGVKHTVRRSPGGEIAAACGQLALRRSRGEPGGAHEVHKANGAAEAATLS